MLYFRLVLCFFLIQSCICDQYFNEYDEFYDEEGTSTEITSTPNVLDYFYDQLAIDIQLSNAYKSKVTAMRDNYAQDLRKFIEWFKHQPEHLKHVLSSLSQVREQHIEPMVKKITNALHSFPKLENLVQDKDNLFHKLLKKNKRYEIMCSFNCDEKEERYVFKREIKDEYYCSSLEELHDKIINKLNETVEQLKEKIIKKLSNDNENYKESMKSIKNNLTDRALQEFGRTMYDILFLQDQYHHFVEDLNITTVEKNIFSLKELSVQLDDKLLQMDKVVEKYGQHCKNCNEGLFVRNMRNTKSNLLADVDSENIVDILIDGKFNETNVKIENDWDDIFNDLNELIKQVEAGNTDIANLKPIQEDILKMTNVEKQNLETLKNKAPQSTIKKVLDLINKSDDLLKTIDEKISTIKALVNQ
ncbi:unnamed protein product [Euphydryas editha]|uniref:Uncharacterized protein n=1 Tax=Euphydryas editha TaxID=104508 RepID=A0AAU9TZ71_EUPED|nr:unnamed protein product [Euphydryas editha]